MSSATPRPDATFLESEDEIRAAIAARLAAKAAPVPEAKLAPAPGKKSFPNWIDSAAVSADDNPAQPYRPTRRPPMALLCVVDDIGEGGAWHRLTKDRTVIGRLSGDILIPYDPAVAPQHAELVRSLREGQWRWAIRDLGSAAGTLVRIGKTVLKHGQEFQVGRSRYRFDFPAAGGDPGTAPRGGALGQLPTVVECGPAGGADGGRIFLTAAEVWIGRHADCQIVSDDDPFVSPRHARLFRDEAGRWLLQNNRSPNGVWLRVDHMALDGKCQFLLGEQRFKHQASAD